MKLHLPIALWTCLMTAAITYAADPRFDEDGNLNLKSATHYNQDPTTPQHGIDSAALDGCSVQLEGSAWWIHNNEAVNNVKDVILKGGAFEQENGTNVNGGNWLTRWMTTTGKDVISGSVTIRKGGLWFQGNGLTEYTDSSVSTVEVAGDIILESGLYSTPDHPLINSNGETFFRSTWTLDWGTTTVDGSVQIKQGAEWVMNGGTCTIHGGVSLSGYESNEAVEYGWSQWTQSKVEGRDNICTIYGDVRLSDSAYWHQEKGDVQCTIYGNVILDGTNNPTSNPSLCTRWIQELGITHVTGNVTLIGQSRKEDRNIGAVLTVDGSITIGSGSTWEQERGQLNASGIVIQEGGTFEYNDLFVTNSTSVGTVLVEKGGTYNLSKGRLKAKEGASLSLKIYGSFTTTGSGRGAFIEGDSVAIDLYDGGVFEVNGSTTFASSTVLTVHGGSLQGTSIASLDLGNTLIDTAPNFKGKIDMGGLNAAEIGGIRIHSSDVTVENIGGDTLTLHQGDVLTFGDANVSKRGESSTTSALLQFAQKEGSKVTVQEGETVLLDFSGSLLKENADENGQVTLEVFVTNGSLDTEKKDWSEYFKMGTGWNLHVSNYDAEKGTLLLSGNVAKVWVSTADGDLNKEGHADAKASDLIGYGKIDIDEDTSITADADATLEQLQGENDSTLSFVKDESVPSVELTLSVKDSKAGNTSFKGTMTSEEGVNLKKTGDAALTVEGNLQANGNVTVAEGALVLGEGSESFIDGELSIGGEGTLQVDGELILSGKGNLAEGSFVGAGTVVLDGAVTFGDELNLGEELTFEIGNKIEGVDFGRRNVTLNDLSGQKSITANAATLTGNGDFCGTITGSSEVKKGSVYCLDGATVTGDLVVRNGSTVSIKVDFNNDEVWGEKGTFVNEKQEITCGGKIIIEDGARFVVQNLTDIVANHPGESLKNIRIMVGGSGIYTCNGAYEKDGEQGLARAKRVDVELSDLLRGLFKEAWISFSSDEMSKTGRAVDLTAESANGDLHFVPYSLQDIRDSARSSVAYAGGMLLNHHVSEHHLNSDPDVLKVTTAIGSVIDSTPAEANRIRAAVAGSTLTSVSAAQSAALRNQMGRVRDHALQAARLRCMGNDEASAQQHPCKNSHVWVEGTSFFSEQHSVGDESGYRLNSWGGALGIDAHVDAHWSVGVSLSASYGDLEARAADYAKGDLDTYTVSFWSQAKNGRWGNTLLFTLGTNEADLKRTVNYGAGSYTATSNTSGSSLGAMWEVTYDLHPVKDNKSNILQPLFNVAVMHTSMDGFSEGNAGNVGLTTEKQTRDTVTLGLGLRWLAAINSAKAINRTVTTEVHANVAQDMGDRRSVANVALLADPSYTQNVYGSKAGSTAFQFGAGVNVPMTPNSQIYVNAGGELREHANAWNATLGVRMGF